MADKIANFDVFLYTDDTKVFREICKTDDEMSLHTDLNDMLQWSLDSLLRFQVYMMDNKYLAHSSEEKDLGVIIDTDLKFDKHIAS